VAESGERIPLRQRDEAERLMPTLPGYSTASDTSNTTHSVTTHQQSTKQMYKLCSMQSCFSLDSSHKQIQIVIQLKLQLHNIRQFDFRNKNLGERLIRFKKFVTRFQIAHY